MGETIARRGDWMQTFTGRAFWPLDPRADEIEPADIAHALSMLCRYGGHVQRFYSVAEHCVLMSCHAEVVYGRHVALEALLHDAAEAYVVDLPRPVKRHMPEYRAVEDNVLAVIFESFGVIGVSAGRERGQLSPVVKAMDNRILLDERAALLATPPGPWHQDLEALDPLGVMIIGWTPECAEAAYLARLSELTR